MSRLVPAVLLLAASALASAPAPQPTPTEIAQLVEKLGSPDFTEREAATKRLEEFGTAAIAELRAATTSDTPETARRAGELLRKAERQLANEKAIAPTLVQLDAKNTPLDDVLAELSKQAKYEVVLRGTKSEGLAGKRVSVSTNGEVPFWAAVLAVCDAADLQIAGAAGFYAPGSMMVTLDHQIPDPVRPGFDRRGLRKSGARRGAGADSSVVLVARDKPRRPAAVRGAVLVEAVPLPAVTPAQPTALLQVWPEPRLQWQGMAAVTVTRATDAAGARLAAEGDGPPAPPNPTIVERRVAPPAPVLGTPGFALAGGSFTPNARQAVVRVKPEGDPPAAIKELGVSLFGAVRSGVEPASRVVGLVANAPAAGVGVPGVDVSVTYRPGGKGKCSADVAVAFDPRDVHPAGAADELPGTTGGGAGIGNHTVHGVRVTDADGKPYLLGLIGGSNAFDPASKRVVITMSLELHPGKDGLGPPAAVTFWGTYSKPVEVAVTLKDVPLSGGK